MNSIRRLIPSWPQQIFLGKRLYASSSKDLTDEENKRLYEKLSGEKNDEKQIEASAFARWVTPHYKFGPSRLMTYDWSVKSLINWFKRKREEFQVFNQKYSADRVKALGSDLAVAHFVVFRGGAVRFRGHNEFIRWTNKREEYSANLPKSYDPKYFVEAIDVSNIRIYYQGLENFKNLYKIKWLSLKNNPVLDNWCLDYIAHTIPYLEYLDISGCTQVTGAGIAGLQKLTQLKELVVSGSDIELQMACFALEDTIPGLFITILDINDKNLLKQEVKEKLNVNQL